MYLKSHNNTSGNEWQSSIANIFKTFPFLKICFVFTILVAVVAAFLSSVSVPFVVMAGVLFEDIFDVKDVDPDGKKFDRG